MDKKFLRAYARQWKMTTKQAENEVLRIMEKVCKSLAYTYRFPGHEAEDIEQQGYIEALKVISSGSYDIRRPLENFLHIHLNKRLSNYRRDNYIRFEKPCKCPCEKWNKSDERNTIKKNIISPIDINQVRDEDEENMRIDSKAHDDLVMKELQQTIDDCLPASLRGDYLKLMAGQALPKNRRQQVQIAVKSILMEGGCLYGEKEEWLASQDY